MTGSDKTRDGSFGFLRVQAPQLTEVDPYHESTSVLQ